MSKDSKEWYAVAEGRRKGIYTNWEDAKEQTEGYSGNMVKKFPDLESAGEFMEDGYHSSPGYTPPNPDGNSGWARGQPDYREQAQYQSDEDDEDNAVTEQDSDGDDEQQADQVESSGYLQLVEDDDAGRNRAPDDDDDDAGRNRAPDDDDDGGHGGDYDDNRGGYDDDYSGGSEDDYGSDGGGYDDYSGDSD